MKIEIYKKAKDENIYFSYEGGNEKNLNFENLKELSELFLEKKKKGMDTSYNIESVAELSLYKNTMEEVLSDICEDEELYNLYIANSSNE